jgi:hypothetical protein
MRLSAKGAVLLPAWGNAPGIGTFPKHISAECAIQMR